MEDYASICELLFTVGSIEASELSEQKEARHPDIQTSGHPGIQTSGHPGIQSSGHPKFSTVKRAIHPTITVRCRGKEDKMLGFSKQENVGDFAAKVKVKFA